MAKDDFKIVGVKETVRALKKLNSDKDTRAILLAAMRKGGTPLVNEAKNQLNKLEKKDGTPRADIDELKKDVKKRTSRNKKFPTIIVGFAKPSKAKIKFYQRYVEKGTERMQAGWSFYKSFKIAGKDAKKETLEAFLDKFNARARRIGFKEISA